MSLSSAAPSLVEESYITRDRFDCSPVATVGLWNSSSVDVASIFVFDVFCVSRKA